MADYCYIKDLHTFETIAQIPLLDYSLGFGQDGNAVLFKAFNNANYQALFSNQWCAIDSHLFYIESVQPQDAQLTLSLKAPYFAFSRALPLEGQSYGEIIENALGHYISGDGDTWHAMPYISVTNTDDTAASIEPDEYGYFVPSSFMDSAAAAGVVIAFRITGVASLAVDVSPANYGTENIFFGDGHNIGESENFDSSTVSKVTVIYTTESETTPQTMNYYLENGEAVTTPPAVRMRGKWETTSIKVSADVAAETKKAAQDIFSKNIDSLKLTFLSDRRLNLYQDVSVRTQSGQVYATKITAYTIAKKNNRIAYSCGNMATTLTEKIKRTKT